MTEKNSSTSVRLGCRISLKLTLLYALNSSYVSCLITFSFWHNFRQWLPLS